MKGDNGLTNKSISGVIWTFADVVVNKAGFFLATIYIARILGPDIYGLIGMITIFITIGNSLVDSGMSVSLIRSPKITTLDVSSVFIGSLIVSVAVYLLFFILAPYVSDFYSQPILTDVIRVYCLIFVISAFRVVQSSLIIRDLEFKKNTLLTLPAVILSIIVGILFAKFGFGIWSVVYMYLVQQVILTILLWVYSDWLFKFGFSKEVFKKHFLFGYKLTLSGLLNTACGNLNNVLIGRFYSLQQSGFYERSYSLNLYPVTVFTAIISKVSMPVLSKIQNDSEKVSFIFHFLLKYSFLLMSFLMLIMFIFAEDIIYIMLGNEWINAVPYLKLLVLSSIFVPIHMFNVNVLQVYGRSDYFLRAEMIKKTIQVFLIVLLFRFGIMWLISSMIFLSVVEIFINAYYVRKVIPFSVKDQVKSFFPSLIPFLFFLLVYIGINMHLVNLQEKLSYFLFVTLIYIVFSYLNYKKDIVKYKNT